jgi:hypothetical protein
MGDVTPIGPLEWALVVDHHKVLFGNKNRDMQSLQHKFNKLALTEMLALDWMTMVALDQMET